MKKTVIGILAHVDAGKTTLAEALLYHCGKVRKVGRVDHKDTLLDNHALERERGITIFAGQAQFSLGEWDVTLLDTPGHVDFSAETERMLQVLDYAVLVVSGIDGVQAHTRTLWRLLKHYEIPTFVFVTKMDFARRTAADVMAELQKECSADCVDFSPAEIAKRQEALAMQREDLLETYLATGEVSVQATAELIRSRQVFPCYFGSGLKCEGVAEFAAELERFLLPSVYGDAFGAKVFKISRDPQGNRLTHLKVTGGSLKVRDIVAYDGKEEKINQIRLYSGLKFDVADEVTAGGVCAVTGLTDTHNGQGLGAQATAGEPLLEPVMRYRLVLPEGCDPQRLFMQLRQLEEEEPQLHIGWNGLLKEIYVDLMGEIQTEILKYLIEERFGVAVETDTGRVVYKETITDTVEGVGHYEPLRHYAEVHLLLEPLPRGSGLQFAARCHEDTLDRHWQRLIISHLAERTHRGVLTGAPITDVRITLMSGRAHLKHTEGGDFRQATYRAVRQGLMQASSVLLEPYYAFRLEVPPEHIGRAITDMRLRHSTIEAPQESGALTLIKGRGPVTTLGDYATQVAAYTGGRGRFSFVVAGYDRCHNEEAIVAAQAYDPEGDVEHTPDSVFCAHGAGFTVKWSQVADYMHLESCLTAEKDTVPRVNTRNLRIDEKELEAIMEREFGKPRHPLFRQPPKPVVTASEPYVFKEKRRYLLVDGYNVIFAWDELRQLAQTDLAAARDRLTLWLSNYSAFSHCETVLIFDAYRVAGNAGSREDAGDIRVVYTKENETADTYIEKLTEEIGKNHQVRVVSSDGMIQLSAVRTGVLRMPVSELQHEIAETAAQLQQTLDELGRHRLGTVGENQKDS
ncbi:MAG: GTP-binding protein [Ruminococcaceae bacterium]|nr:GTP-binding protein [Oscillospiraceae bacterium]